MEFIGEVLRDISIDPYFKIKFYFETENVKIAKGFAEITRCAPKPVIVYDAATEEKLRSIDTSKLELELVNTVMTYMFTNGVTRNWRGNLVLSSV